MLLNILFIIALTSPVAVASTVLGMKGIMPGEDKNNSSCAAEWGRNLVFALVLALAQGVMYILGDLLGSTFMHLMESLSKWIVFALCFSIFYRMLMNTLKIRRGDNLYFVQNPKQLILLSIALGVNAFIAGMMTEFYEPFSNLTPCVIAGVAFLWSLISMTMPFSQIRLTYNSLLNVVSAFIILMKGLLNLI